MAKLTVGRIVHAYANRMPNCEFGWRGPKAALVTHVGGDYAILRVFTSNCAMDKAVHVSLSPEGNPDTDGHEWRWRWPPRDP
jgi:hypothetical protein